MSDAKNKILPARSVKIAAARAEREARLAVALRANLKRRKDGAAAQNSAAIKKGAPGGKS
jgi:hypothetical protein